MPFAKESKILIKKFFQN